MLNEDVIRFNQFIKNYINMKKVKNWLNADEFEVVGEVNDLPSMTVPDDSMSIREILDRFARGLPIDGFRVPMYDEDNDMPDIRTLDFAERQQLAEMYENELEALQARRSALNEPENTTSSPAATQATGTDSTNNP